MSEDNQPLAHRAKTIQPTEVIDYLDGELARAVIKCRQSARTMSKDELDKIVANFLLTTGVKLAINGGITPDEIQAIVKKVLEL